MRACNLTDDPARRHALQRTPLSEHKKEKKIKGPMGLLFPIGPAPSVGLLFPTDGNAESVEVLFSQVILFLRRRYSARACFSTYMQVRISSAQPKLCTPVAST